MKPLFLISIMAMLATACTGAVLAPEDGHMSFVDAVTFEGFAIAPEVEIQIQVQDSQTHQWDIVATTMAASEKTSIPLSGDGYHWKVIVNEPGGTASNRFRVYATGIGVLEVLKDRGRNCLDSQYFYLHKSLDEAWQVCKKSDKIIRLNWD